MQSQNNIVIKTAQDNLQVGDYYLASMMFWGCWKPFEFIAGILRPRAASDCYSLLCNLQSFDGIVRLPDGQRTLAARLGANLRSVRRYIQILEDEGYIRSFRDGPNRPKYYLLVWTAALEADLRSKRHPDYGARKIPSPAPPAPLPTRFAIAETSPEPAAQPAPAAPKTAATQTFTLNFTAPFTDPGLTWWSSWSCSPSFENRGTHGSLGLRSPTARPVTDAPAPVPQTVRTAELRAIVREEVRLALGNTIITGAVPDKSGIREMVQQAMREAAPPAPANIPAPAAPTPEAPVESPAEIAARRSARMAHAAQIAMAHAAAKSAQQNAPAAAPPAPIRSLDDYDWDAMLAAFRSTGDSTPLKEAVAACGKNPMGLEAAFARAAQRIADALPKEPPADTMRGSVDPSDLFGDSSEEEEEAAAVESAESPGLEPASAPRTPFPHGSAAAAAPAGADVGRWIVSRPAPEACVDPAQYSPEELRAARLAPPVRRLAIDTDPYLPLPAELERQVQRARTLRFFPTRDPGARDAELAELRRLFIRYDLTPKEADRTMNHLLEWSKAAGVAEILARQYPDGVYYAEPFRRLPTMLCRHCEDTGILGREGEEHSCACAAGWELTRRWRPAWDREGNSPQRRAWRNDGLQPPVQTNGKERMPAGSEERSMPGESKERLC